MIMLIIIIIGKCNYDDAQSRSKYMGVVGRLRFARKPICVIGESLKYNLLEIYMIYFWNDHKATEKLNFKHLSKPVCCWYILALKNLSIMYYLCFPRTYFFPLILISHPEILKKWQLLYFFIVLLHDSLAKKCLHA